MCLVFVFFDNYGKYFDYGIFPNYAIHVYKALHVQAFIQDFLLGGGNFFGVTNQPHPLPQELCYVSFNAIFDIFKEKNRRIQL